MSRIRAGRAADEAELAGIDAAAWSPDVTPAGERPADAPFFTDRTSPEDVLVAMVGDRSPVTCQCARAVRCRRTGTCSR